MSEHLDTLLRSTRAQTPEALVKQIESRLRTRQRRRVAMMTTLGVIAIGALVSGALLVPSATAPLSPHTMPITPGETRQILTSHPASVRVDDRHIALRMPSTHENITIIRVYSAYTQSPQDPNVPGTDPSDRPYELRPESTPEQDKEFIQ